MTPIPLQLWHRACERIEEAEKQRLPFKHRGIYINRQLIRTAMEVLNSAPGHTLPQNSRNAVTEKTPDGLDRRIKETLATDLRTANIISDVLARSGIVQNVQVKNFNTDRIVKGTKLREDWGWPGFQSDSGNLSR